MSINLSKVNISLNEFQRLSIGEHNAGEVKLAGETKLAKMNHHVGSFFVNKDIISHEEVIAISSRRSSRRCRRTAFRRTRSEKSAMTSASWRRTRRTAISATAASCR